MNFESTTEIKAKREKKNREREIILNEAKRKYDIEERKAQAAKSRGEDTWMLPELSAKIDKDAKKLSKKSKKLKKKKQEKKNKKDKKKRKKSSSSSGSEDSDGEEKWVEKTKDSGKEKQAPSQPTPVVKGPQLQRDDWMTLDAVNIPTVSRQELREKIKQDKLQYADDQNTAKPELNIDEPGQHDRELNPYWKQGSGTGLPEEMNQMTQESPSSGPKHSLEFLQKAYKRCEQMAEESGQSLDEIAAERYGSLEQLQMMIMEAEREKELRASDKDNKNRTSYNKYNDRDRGKHASSEATRDRIRTRHSRSRSREKSRRDHSGDRKQTRNRSRDKHRSRSRSRDGRRSRSRSRDRRQSRSRSRDRRRNRSRDRYRSRDRSRSKDRRRGGDHSPDQSKRRFLKPGESASSGDSAPTTKRRFLKPGESSSGETVSKTKDSSRPSWRKPGHESSKPQPSAKGPTESASDTKKRKSSESSHSDSGSDSSASSAGSKSDQSDTEETQPQVVALTDDEMNTLGAKILKAEIMGNAEMAVKLKSQLESARQARAAGVKPPQKDESEKVIVLSRTDKFGNVRPVQSHDPDQVKSGGKKRRAKKIQTHDKSGQRERYFADDDRFNIKDMVQAEKMTSAEDQHLLFSKMAAKVTEKIDDDNQIDDAMINRARLEQDPKKIIAAQHSKAQADSKRMAQTLDDCHQCLDNMTKHLIIAVHKNTYLCVPEHQSLSEGHCRIVPIHHCISSTQCDEDVWSEVQEFRRALVKMFAANDDQDCVFMECSKNLRKHPHMVIDCIPLERELGDMAPIYFKKAIQESEKEWSQNKKLVDLSKKDIRHSIPKGFPYFSVDFGLQDGFAHVIEDEQNFPYYFGKEVLGGMMDVDNNLWRKPRKESFEDQRKKVLNFAKMWRPHDITAVKEATDSD